MAVLNNRNFIGVDISEEYCRISKERIESAINNKVIST
jgi:DNA modification methylase